MSDQSFCMSLDVEQPEADLEAVYAGGPPGLAATIAVGGVQTLAPGAAATVENVGTENAAVLAFGIPQGPHGIAATITAGATTTLAPDQPAAVTNVGTASDAVLNFGIPKGDKGDPGSNGAGFDYTQGAASDLWTVAHNLGFRPSVSTFTVGGVGIVGSVQHLSADVLQIGFNTPVAGFARLN